MSLFPESFCCFSFALNFFLPPALSLDAQFTAKMFLWVIGLHLPRPLAPPSGHWRPAVQLSFDKASMPTPHFLQPEIQGLPSGFSPRRLRGKGRDLEGVGFRRPGLLSNGLPGLGLTTFCLLASHFLTYKIRIIVVAAP